MRWSQDLVWEQALLISNGVRPLAIVGYSPNNEQDMNEALASLTEAGDGVGGVIPFVVPTFGDAAVAGFASEQWTIDLFVWLHTPEVIDSRMYDLILGMLLGYSAKSIAEYDAKEQFPIPGQQINL